MSRSKLFSLDLWKNKPITIDVKQNDARRKISIDLKANGEEVDLTGKTVKYFVKKGDGNTVFNDCEIVDEKIGSILVSLTNQATAVEGTNEMELAIYDENGAVESTFTVYLQVTKTLIDDNRIESSNEFKALNDALGMVQGIDNKFKAVNSQLDKNATILSGLNQKFCSGVGINIWYMAGSTESYYKEVIYDMVRLGIKNLIIPCHINISQDSSDNYIYTKELSNEQISNLVTYAKSKGIENIIIKLHRKGIDANNTLEWLEMWFEVIKEYCDICVSNGINTISLVNEQRNSTNANRDKWVEIINYVKNKHLKVLCSLADFSEYDSCSILDLVDIIGINHYPAVVKKGEVITQEELNKRIYNYSIPMFKKIKKKYNKPIWVTEIGCTRNKDALTNPAKWEFDTEEQSDIPQSMFVESVFSIFACIDDLIDNVFWWSSDNKNKINTFTFFGNGQAEANFKKYLKEME